MAVAVTAAEIARVKKMKCFEKEVRVSIWDELCREIRMCTC